MEIDTSGFMNSIISFTTQNLLSFWPVASMIAGVLLAFYVIERLVQMFIDNKYGPDDNRASGNY